MISIGRLSASIILFFKKKKKLIVFENEALQLMHYWYVSLFLHLGRHAGTPLHHAAKRGLERTVSLFLVHGGGLIFFSLIYLTLLNNQQSYHLKYVNWLFLSKSSTNALVMNDDCQTPLDVARAKGHCSVVRAIVVCHCSLLRQFKNWSHIHNTPPCGRVLFCVFRLICNISIFMVCFNILTRNISSSVYLFYSVEPYLLILWLDAGVLWVWISWSTGTSVSL